MRERIYKMADEIFETWPPAMLQLFEEQSQAEAETQQLNTAKQLLSTNVTQQIETLNEAGMFTLSNTHIKNLYPSSLNPFPLIVGHWFMFLGWTDICVLQSITIGLLVTVWCLDIAPSLVCGHLRLP
jgi:hypothetical protein